MDMLDIRKAEPQDTADLKVIIEQELRFLRSVYRPTIAGHANKSRISPHLTRLVGVFEGRVVGTVQYYVQDSFMRLTGLAVHEHYRRRGIARALVNHVLAVAKQMSCPAARLSVIKETGNIPIFERLGFEIAGESADQLCEGLNGEIVTDVIMERGRS
jgi:ribosomal protein S18 acetylase RimI-like enzyme